MKGRHWLLVFIVFYGLVFLISDYRDSYKTIDDAIIHNYKDSESVTWQIEQLIGGSEYERKALYFFLNKENNIVVVGLSKGLWGWKVNNSSTGTGLEPSVKNTFSKGDLASVNDSHHFYFGLTSFDNIGRIMINKNTNASMINLNESLNEVDELSNTYLWYTYLYDEARDHIVEVYDNHNNLVHTE